MAARRRSKRKSNWPDNLYESGGYFSWRNPVDGKHFGLGRILFPDAARQAREANLHVSGQLQQPTLVDRLTGTGQRTVDAWCTEFEKLLRDRKYADTTLRQHLSKLKTIRTELGVDVIERVDTLRINGFLKPYLQAGKERMAQSMRSFLMDMFREAIAEGWIGSRVNPVDITREITVDIKRERLVWETFNAIHKQALQMNQPWIARSMELALVSAQRREDLANAQFTQREGAAVYVADGLFWIDQGKSGSRIRLPLDLRLEVLGLSIKDVIGRCRDNVVSRWLLHHTSPVGKTKPGDQVWIDTISKGFRRARDRTGITWEGEPPTFHEIRSLSERMYKEQGNVDTQILLGHKDPRSTRIYHDSRGAEWIDLKVG